MVSAARKADTSIPFIIYDFYEQLAEVRSIFKIFLVINWLLFPTNLGVDREITNKEIKKVDILKFFLLPWKIWFHLLYVFTCDIYVYTCKTFILHLFFSHVSNDTHFFKVVEHNPEIHSSCIWNSDKSGFPTNLLKGCVIAKKASKKKALQIFYFFLS